MTFFEYEIFRSSMTKIACISVVNIHPYSQRAFWTATDSSFNDWATFEFFNKVARVHFTLD
jgi:surface polysaccharide O-acyltransferase-like enzyme